MLILPDFVKFSSMADSVSASKEVDDCSCILCYRVIEKAHERYLVAGKSKFNAKEAIEQLPFAVFDSSPYICRQCLDKLRKRSSLLCQEKIIVTKLTIAYEKGKLKKRQNTSLEEGPPSKRTNVSGFPTPIVSTTLTTSLPHSPCSETTETSRIPVHHFNPNFPPVAIAHSTPVKEHLPAKSSVNVRVSWPSKTVEKKLHSHLESLGKMLVRGTFKQIANAAWKIPQIRRHLTVNVLKEVDKECSNLCSKKNPSCLRSPSQEKLLEFSLEKENEELEKRAPLFYSVLVAAGSNRRKTDKSSWIPAVGMAASVLLRNRSPYMNTIQLMLGNFLYHSNCEVSLF